MPLWNKRDYVAASVAGVLAQTREDFELVVIDDGSTDGSRAIVDGFGDPRIRVLAQANAGPGAARNAGIAAARHDWIAFLDADDVWRRGHLAELDRLRSRFPGAGLIGTSYVDPDRADPWRRSTVPDGLLAAADYFARLAAFDPPFCTSSAAIPKRSYAEFGGFGRCPAGEDTAFWVRIALARPVAVSSRATAAYRRNTGGITDTMFRTVRARPPASLGEIAPTAALLIERGPAIAEPRTQRAAVGLLESRLRSCVRVAARAGDLRTLRALPRLSAWPLPPADRLIAALAWAPPAFARRCYSTGFALRARLRAAKRIREPDWAPDGRLRCAGE